MSPRLLLDTHIIIRWLSEPRRLSREQLRAIEKSAARREPLTLSAVSLLEIAVLVHDGRLEIDHPLDEFLGTLDQDVFRVMPLTPAVAFEAGSLTMLKDPFDRTIAATARVHALRLVTSDQRIIDSNLVSIIH